MGGVDVLFPREAAETAVMSCESEFVESGQLSSWTTFRNLKAVVTFDDHSNNNCSFFSFLSGLVSLRLGPR